MSNHTSRTDQGWRTCQTYARQLAQCTSFEQAVELADRAERIASNETDQYRRTAVLMWPMAALRSRGLDGLADAMFDRVFPDYELIEPYSSRASAIHLLIFAGPFDQARTERICSLMSHTARAESPPHWRVAFAVKCFVQSLGTLDEKSAGRFVEELPPGKMRNKCVRILEQRDFHWMAWYKPSPLETAPPDSQ